MTKSCYHNVLLQLIMSYMASVGALAQTTPPAQPLALHYTAPDSYLIEDIQVTGIQTLDQEAIVAITGLKAGDTVPIPGPAIKDAIQRLWKQQLIKDVAIYASQGKEHRVVLTIHITESPRLSAYSLEGIKRKEQEKLLEKLALVKGKVVTDELIKNTQQLIEDYWIEEGYLHTKVTITSLPDPTQTDHTQLNIKIDKGEQLSINAVHFQGNQHISSNVLRAQMQHIQEKPRFTLVKDMLKQVLTLQPIRQEGILWRPLNFEEISHYFQEHVILCSSKLNPTKLEEDKKRIISYYQRKGFRDVAIVDEAVYKQDDDLLNVWIKIEEGKQYRVGDIRWVGNYLYDDDTLHQILDIKKGDLYNPSLLQQRLYNNPAGKDIASLYIDDGHLFFQAEPVEVGLEGNTVALEIRLQEGPQARINKVLIEGNSLTHDYVIQRELRTLPGDKFSRAKLQRSYRELALLNIFDPAIDILPIPNFADNTVDIRYKVKERPKFEVKFSLSLGGGNQDFIGALTLATNNFSLGNLFRWRLPVGGGQTLGLRAETNGKEYKNFSFQFTEPWLGGKRPRQFHLSLSKSFEGNRGSAGGRVSLSTKLSWPDDYTIWRSSIAYYRHNYEDYDLLGTGEKFAKGMLHDLSTSISLERNSTDNPIYPKEGSKLELSAHLTPPWSWCSHEDDSRLSKPAKYRWKEYHQWMLDGSYFLRLLDDLVLNFRGHFGVLGKFPAQKSIGPFERFYLGGNGLTARALRGKENISLRGYKDDYITPEDKETGYKGGVIYDKFVLELRYPIIFHYFTSIYALAFAEAGNTWAQYEDCHFFKVKKSAGVGLRVYVPFLIGTTLGFDWGYGFDKKPTDKAADKLAFHFSIGMGLR